MIKSARLRRGEWPCARTTALRTALAAAAILALPMGAYAQTLRIPPGVSGEDVPGRTVLRHNPVFGLGPQTIWKGGLGVELEGELTRRKGRLEEERLALHAELMYGITQDVSLALAMPIVQRRSETGLAPGGGQIDRDATGSGRTNSF